MSTITTGMQTRQIAKTATESFILSTLSVATSTNTVVTTASSDRAVTTHSLHRKMALRQLWLYNSHPYNHCHPFNTCHTGTCCQHSNSQRYNHCHPFNTCHNGTCCQHSNSQRWSLRPLDMHMMYDIQTLSDRLTK